MIFYWGRTNSSSWIKWLSTFLTMTSVLANKSPRLEISPKSKFMLGGLFPIHAKGPDEHHPCGPIFLEKGIQRLEAMLFAIDEVNEMKKEYGFSLGATILDTCSSDSFALEQSLQLLQSSCGSRTGARKVTGVVGAANSAVSEAVANIFRLFKIPQVSYASTSEELDNLHKYPYFFRVVPSDRFQVRVMLEILHHFNWTYISAVASEGDYGEKAIKNLQDIVNNSTKEEICFAEVCILPRDSKEEDYEKAVKSLDQHEEAKVVIVFLNEEKVRRLLSTVQRHGLSPDRFIWLGSDGWGAKMHAVRGLEEYAEDAITILPERYPIETGFDKYFLSLRPENNTRNPWFKEFWQKQFNCVFNSSKIGKNCTGKEDLRKVYKQEGLVPMVIDSVRLLSTGIEAVCNRHSNLCEESCNNDPDFRKRLKEEIKKIKLKSSQGHDMIISFDSERNIPTSYIIYQFQKLDKYPEEYTYAKIGQWSRKNETKLSMDEEVLWKREVENTISVCSKPCAKGEERTYHNPKKRCCWICRPCDGPKYLPHVLGRCTTCPSGQIPVVPDKTSCMRLELDYIGKNLRSAWALVPFLFSILGLLVTLVVFLIFFLNHKTPIIMASGRELCYVILIGVVFCYCFTFVALYKPSKITCGIFRIGMGLGLSVCYSAIFTKTNRISRIFNRRLRITKRPSYISPESQVVICLCLILIQVTLSAMWLIVTPPAVKQLTFQDPFPAWVAFCGLDGMSLLLGLVYNMILIMMCTYYAYKTRNIPENFNESKYISFTMYSSCIIWLAFIPIYCSAWKDFMVQSTILCMSVSMSGTVTLACLFFPKIYIVLLRPEKNVRYPGTGSSSATGGFGTNSPVRFVRPTHNVVSTQHFSPSQNNVNRGTSTRSFIIENKCTQDIDAK